MDLEEFRVRGKEMVDYMVNYMQTIRERPVFPSVKPGYMKCLLPDKPPDKGESFETIMNDVERIIMPGITHWHSPYMHAYFPALTSPASILGEMLSSTINCLGFSWASSPACTELEIIMMDWLAKAIGLPEYYLHSNPNTTGGGVIQTSLSEATLVCMLAARTKAIRKLKTHSKLTDEEIYGCLVAYGSDQSHSSFEKATLIALVKFRLVETDEEFSLRGDKLAEAIERDKSKGLTPFFLCATLGTTGCCSFDNLKELGPICAKEDIWLHVDAAYAGTAFLCPEFRHFMAGIEYSSSFAMNASKWMMVSFDCTNMWVKDSTDLHRTFSVTPIYLKHENEGIAVDFMNWQIHLGRKFRSLKLWFVIRNFGIEGLQEHIRRGVRLASLFENKLRSNKKFEVASKRHLGMVAFCIRGSNRLTKTLLKRINSTGKMYCVPALLRGKYIIRYTVTSTYTEESDLERDWTLIECVTNEITSKTTVPRSLSLPDFRPRRCLHFGTSLVPLLPTSLPRFIKGSHVASLTELAELEGLLPSTYVENLGVSRDRSPVPWMRARFTAIEEKRED